jgi:hypothetical protein
MSRNKVFPGRSVVFDDAQPPSWLRFLTLPAGGGFLIASGPIRSKMASEEPSESHGITTGPLALKNLSPRWNGR